MRAAGVVDKRWGNPSWSELGRRTGRHASTLIAMADGKRQTEIETIARVAEALRLDFSIVNSWIPNTGILGDLYEPPAESRLLTENERDALTSLIKAIASSRHTDVSTTGFATSDESVTPLEPKEKEGRGRSRR
jgi:hypothetical protein